MNQQNGTAHGCFGEFIHNLYQRFVSGSTDRQFPSSFSFPYDCHCGPIDQAVIDAKEQEKSLFLFIYCEDNPVTFDVVSILQMPNIADEIREHFVFYPLSATSPEGWKLANNLKFTKMPIIALVRPHGSSFWESRIFMSNFGIIDETNLLSSIRVERNPETTIVTEQNNEFDQLQAHEEEMQRRAIEEEERAQHTIEQIQAEFENLPSLPPSAPATTIRFFFPDGNARTFRFPVDSPVHYLFVYVRNFMFPVEFALMTGFPQIRLIDDETPLNQVCPERQFIVHVEQIENA